MSEKIPTADPSFDSANPDPSCSNVSYRLYNIGNHEPVGLMEFIETMEEAIGKNAIKNIKPMQAGDVKVTYAETTDLRLTADFVPRVSIETAIKQLISWLGTSK